jgi:hypothetical protein
LIVPPSAPVAHPRLLLQADGGQEFPVLKNGKAVANDLTEEILSGRLSTLLEIGDKLHLTGAVGDWYVFLIDTRNLADMTPRIRECQSLRFSLLIPRLEIEGK